MIKTKGDKKVENWTHPRSGVTCDIYLRHTSFVAVLLERPFEAPDVAILRKKLSDYAEAWLTLEWHGILEIDIEDRSHSYRDDPTGESLTLKRKRYYLGMSPAGEIFQVDFDVDEAHRKAKMSSMGGGYSRGDGFRSEIKLTGLPLKAPMKQGDSRYIIDYTEELWAKTDNILAGIANLRLMIGQLFATKKGLEMLLTGGGENLLLQDAKPKKAK